MEETNNPIVEKLLDFAKNKSYLTWDEVTEFLGQDFVNSPEMESIIKILNEKNIQLIEPSIIQPDDVPEDDDVGIQLIVWSQYGFWIIRTDVVLIELEFDA